MSKSFEDQWKKAFNNASDNPPEVVWNKIEKELEKKEESRILPLWFNSNWMAAGIAAMLVMVIGYGVLQHQTVPSIVKAKTTPREESNNVLKEKELLALKNYKSANGLNKEDNYSPEPENQLVIRKDVSSKEEFTNELKISKGGRKYTSFPTDNQLSKIKEQELFIDSKVSKEAVGFDNSILASNSKQLVLSELSDQSNLNVTSIGEEVLSNKTISIDKTANRQNIFGDIEPLEALAYEPFGTRFINTRKMLDVNIDLENKESEITKEKIYFGMNSGMSPYNTNFEANGFVGEAVSAARQDIGQVYSLRAPSIAKEGLTQTNDGFAANILPSNLPQNTFKTGNAISLGFNVGKKVWRNFSLESGLRYLRGTSSMQSNVYTINARSGKVVPFFQEKYISSNAQDFKTIISFTENYDQTYNYIGVPLNLVYNLPLFKNISLSLLAGVSGDIFVGSSYKTSNDENTKLKAQQTNFNTINVSGIEGLRINYNIGNNWELNLGTAYQHALRSGISDANGATFKPNMLGINYGVKYQIGE